MFDLVPVVEFVKQFTDIDADNILQGYSTRTVLPRDQDFCIVSTNDFERVGTNVQTWDNTSTTIRRLIRYSVIVDFIGLDRDKQAERASRIEILARSLEGFHFFKEREIGLLYANSPQYMPFIYDSKEYSHRYRVELWLEQWNTVKLEQQTAARVEVSKIVNVDTIKGQEGKE